MQHYHRELGYSQQEEWYNDEDPFVASSAQIL
jgi:hypothetical protein